MRNTLSKRLEDLREEKDWSKTTVAKKMGVNVSTYSNWEYGYREPEVKSLVSLAQLYDVSLDYLYGRSNEKGILDSDKEFMDDVSDPDLKNWYINEVPKSTEEELKQLRQMWDIIKGSKKDNT